MHTEVSKQVSFYLKDKQARFIENLPRSTNLSSIIRQLLDICEIIAASKGAGSLQTEIPNLVALVTKLYGPVAIVEGVKNV